MAHGFSAVNMALTSEPNGDHNRSGSATPSVNGETSRFKSTTSDGVDNDAASNDTDDNRRPSTAPGQRNGHANGETRDDSAHDTRPKRPVKPLLQRSKSEFGRRPMDEQSVPQEEVPDWGARHGFEDHYQSEHMISELADVSTLFNSLLHLHKGEQCVAFSCWTQLGGMGFMGGAALNHGILMPSAYLGGMRRSIISFRDLPSANIM
jgi:hypothetical protein